MIAIEGMDELPENCHKCLLSYISEGEYWCPWNNCTTDYANGGDRERMCNCPLHKIEVKE